MWAKLVKGMGLEHPSEPVLMFSQKAVMVMGTVTHLLKGDFFPHIVLFKPLTSDYVCALTRASTEMNRTTWTSFSDHFETVPCQPNCSLDRCHFYLH